MNLKVSRIQRGCVYDGRGIRTTVFLHGCHLLCPWCCNPETSKTVKDSFFEYDKCTNKLKGNSQFCQDCEKRMGDRLTALCPFEYSKPIYRFYSSEELLFECHKDDILYKKSLGGVTFSGGEPLLQAEGLINVMSALKLDGIDLALETTLFVDSELLKVCLPFVDEYIIDYKLQPEMKLWDENYSSVMISNLSVIPSNKRLRHRLVCVSGMIHYAEDILKTLKHFDIKELELLKCHNLAEKKYKRLQLPFKTYVPNEAEFEDFCKCIGDEIIVKRFIV